MTRSEGGLPAFWLAVDGHDDSKVMEKLAMIADVPGEFGIKINLDVVLRSPYIIRAVHSRIARPLFVDLKMWNGKRTMTEIVRMLADEGVAMANAYALADHLLEAPAKVARDRGVVFLAVTILTHFTDQYCQTFFGKSMVDTVRMFAVTAIDRGCDGYILPGTCLDGVTDFPGLKFNPGIRPLWVLDRKANAQEQLSTVQESFAKGAHFVSCGSPVFDADDPVDALIRILGEVQAFKK